MSQVSTTYVHLNEPGKGTYGSTLAKLTGALLNTVQKDNIIQLVKSVPFPDKTSTFNLGDYGSADGASSMAFIKDLILSLKEHHGPQVQFQVIYEDQATNDFNSLFKRLSGIIPDPPSYLLKLDNVFPLASGIDFRQQCVPSDSMHFIMSTIAVHWLSKTPVLYKNSIHVYPNGSPEEKKALNEQARMDWETFLLMRSKELKQGGILFVSCAGQCLDNKGMERFPFEILFRLFRNVWLSFRESGKISSKEFLHTNIPFCIYTSEQLKAPFEDQSSMIVHSGLKLVSIELKIDEHFVYAAWKKKKDVEGVDDREEFARTYLTAHWNWSKNTFWSGLSDDRTQQEKEQILEELFVAVEKKIQDIYPEEFMSEFVTNYIVIRKG